ncbi:hypothetical protein M9H77_11009 [Catharanthus roseus]|uniref:Uncharacterized protein n=1 Tax=Catharanthus roseus TaxID=4058 RepID=A0ACC0BDE5_CATRO|nr:hypothetical protein M9H77_11009 [Catharanthus roseus]
MSHPIISYDFLRTKRGLCRQDNNVLSDIVVAHQTSMEMMRTWPYVLIMDTTYKTNNYNLLLLEVVGMILTGKNFTVATAFMRNEQIKHIYFSNAMSTENQQDVNDHEPKTKSVIHFGVETTNRAESEYSVLELWLSTCYGNLDTVFLNIDSRIESQIADIMASLEFSRTK